MTSPRQKSIEADRPSGPMHGRRAFTDDRGSARPAEEVKLRGDGERTTGWGPARPATRARPPTSSLREQVGLGRPRGWVRRRAFRAVRIGSDFLETVGCGERLRTAVSVRRVGRTSVTWHVDASRASDGARAFRMTVVTVCVDVDTFRPVEVPDDLRPRLLALA